MGFSQTIRSEDLLRIHGNYHLCSDDKGRHEESGGLSAVSCDSQKLFDNVGIYVKDYKFTVIVPLLCV